MADTATLQFKADVGGLTKAKTSLDDVTQAAEKTEQAVDKATDAINEVGNAGNKIVPNVNKGKKAIEDLNVAAKKSEISAGQMKAGWSNAANQFIDIGVSLQGGMSPITVMTQQLPQLAMSFGTFGNTLKVFGALITPVTVGITALVAGLGYLGFELYQSYKQTEQFNQALAKSGGQAGLTASQLKDMVSQLQKSTDASEDNARQAVLSAAAISKSSSELEGYAKTALAVSQNTGESVEDLIKRFSKLSGDPVDALRELGDEFGFLNPQLYEQVKAMNDAGDRAGAYALVLDSLQKNMENFKDGQRGGISEVKSWWDELIARVGDYLTTAQQVPTIKVPGAPGSDAVPTGVAWLDTANQQIKKSQDDAAKATANNFAVIENAAKATLSLVNETSKRAKDATTAAMAIDEKTPQYQLRSAKIAEDMKETQRQIEQIRAGGDKAALDRANTLYAAQKKSYDDALKAEAKRGKTKEKATQIDAGDKVTEQYQAQNLALDAQIKILQERSTGELNASQQRKAYYEQQAKFEVLEEAAKTRTLSKQEQQLLASKDQVLAEAAITATKGDQLALLQRQAQINDEIASKSQTIDLSIKSQAENAGKSSKEIQRAVRDAEMLAKLTAKGATDLQKSQALQANARQDAADDAKTQDWVSAGKTAFADWADAATNYADIAKNAVTSGMDTASDAISNFVLTGKLDFASFAQSILKMIADIIAQLLIVNTLKATLGGTSFGSFLGITANANGGVYSDPSLHSYVNGVFDTPQFFQFGGRSQFAKGGVFAEAGAEAIMPLSRDANGRLGVKSQDGGSSSGSIAVNQTVNISSSGATAETDSSGVGKAVGDQLKSVVITEVQKMMKPGGLLYNSGRS